jgi:hypothetical protein
MQLKLKLWCSYKESVLINLFLSLCKYINNSTKSLFELAYLVHTIKISCKLQFKTWFCFIFGLFDYAIWSSINGVLIFLTVCFAVPQAWQWLYKLQFLIVRDSYIISMISKKYTLAVSKLPKLLLLEVSYISSINLWPNHGVLSSHTHSFH